jgi:hypothetical protein
MVLAFYVLTPYLGVPYALISTLFISLNILIVWMVIRVLKDGVPSTKKFSENWYEDLDVEV